MKKIVILSGAGISQESGISTFRDSDGLWENYRVEDVANWDSWQKDEELVRNFYNERRKQVLETSPNAAHKALTELEQKYDVCVVTQNIDNLHERAGSSSVIHLHGEITKACSVDDKEEIYDIEGWEQKATDVDKHGKSLRPFIVWFGEAVPEMEKAAEECEKADIMIVVGTSLNVYPAAGLINYTRPSCEKFLVDPKQPNCSLAGIRFIQKKATEGIREVVDELLSR